MPPQAITDWVAILRRKADTRGITVSTDLDTRIFHFQLGEDPGVIEEVRYSEAKSRNFENEQGKKHIWHRYNREKEWIEDDHDRRVVNITLDVDEKDEFDPQKHHFLFLTERMIEEDTYSKGDQKTWIEGEGRYSGPLAKYVDDWDAIFEYAAGGDASDSRDSADTPSSPEDRTGTDTAGTIADTYREQVQLSQSFREAVYDQFDSRSPLSGITQPALLTISHILDRADHPELAEDIQNVVLLDWNLHMAFDAGPWTFDESGRVWVNPDFDSSSDTPEAPLIDRHGEKIESFSKVADEYIDRHNSVLEWWPPR